MQVPGNYSPQRRSTCTSVAWENNCREVYQKSPRQGTGKEGNRSVKTVGGLSSTQVASPARFFCPEGTPAPFPAPDRSRVAGYAELIAKSALFSEARLRRCLVIDTRSITYTSLQTPTKHDKSVFLFVTSVFPCVNSSSPA